MDVNHYGLHKVDALLILESSNMCLWCMRTKESSLQTSPIDSSLAQLVECGTDYLEVVSIANPTGGTFPDEIYFVAVGTLDTVR